MKFTIDKKGFLGVLEKVRGVVNSVGVIPVLSNILVEVDKERGGLSVSGTNLNQFAKGFCNAQVEEGGVFTINASMFYSIVMALPDKDIYIRSDNKHEGFILLSCGNYNTRLAGLPVKDFPEFPSYKRELMMTFDSSGLKEMIKKTLFSISSDTYKPIFCGTLFEKIEGEGIVRAVSTDGVRLSYVEGEDKNISSKFAVIVPKLFIAEILKLLPKNNEDVLFGISDNNVVFENRDFVFLSNVINGQFPNYRVILQHNNGAGVGVVFNREELTRALRRVAVLDELKTVKLVIDKGSVDIISSAADEDAKDTINTKYEGEPITIGMNAKFMLDVLSVIGSDDVTVNIKAPNLPVLVTSTDNNSYKHIIMPVAIRGD